MNAAAATRPGCRAYGSAATGPTRTTWPYRPKWTPGSEARWSTPPGPYETDWHPQAIAILMWHSWTPLTSITEVLNDTAPNVRVHYHVPRFPYTEKSMEVRVTEITRRPGELRLSDGVIVGRVEVIDYGGDHGTDSLEKLQERYAAWGADPA